MTISCLFLGLGHWGSGFIGYCVFRGMLVRVDRVDCWGAVDVRRTGLSGALGLGPFGGLVVDVLGEANGVCVANSNSLGSESSHRGNQSNEEKDLLVHVQIRVFCWTC